MRLAAKISVFVLRLGCLALLATVPMEIACQQLPDAPQPQNAIPGKDNTAIPAVVPNRSCPTSSAGDQQSNGKLSANPFRRFVTAGKYPPLTPKDKFLLAEREYAGVSFAGTVTGEFFGTFLIPSLAHQDPRYHRMPKASVPRRIGHAIVQVVWTKADDGSDMPNYGTMVGIAATDALGNLYVPGRRADLGTTAQRWATGIGSAPIDNFITEFLPDVASHVNVRVVLFQRIMNGIARNGAQ